MVLMGIIAADIEAKVTENISLLGGIGYQFDLKKGDIQFLGENLGENELEAFFVRAGIAIDL